MADEKKQPQTGRGVSWDGSFTNGGFPSPREGARGRIDSFNSFMSETGSVSDLYVQSQNHDSSDDIWGNISALTRLGGGTFVKQLLGKLDPSTKCECLFDIPVEEKKPATVGEVINFLKQQGKQKIEMPGPIKLMGGNGQPVIIHPPASELGLSDSKLDGVKDPPPPVLSDNKPPEFDWRLRVARHELIPLALNGKYFGLKQREHWVLLDLSFDGNPLNPPKVTLYDSKGPLSALYNLENVWEKIKKQYPGADMSAIYVGDQSIANENSCGHYVIDYMVSILINPDKTIGDFFARHRGIVLSGSVFFPTAGLIFGALTLFMGLDVGLSLELCFYIAVGLVGSTPTVGILRSLWTILTDTGPSTPTPELQPPSVVSPCLRELSQHSVGQGNQQEEVNVAAYHEAESAAYNLAVSVRPQPQPNNGAEEQHGQQSSHTPRIWQSYGLEPNDGPDYAGYDRTGPSPQPVSEVRMGV